MRVELGNAHRIVSSESEDLILAAVNDASHKIDEAMQQKMGGMGAGLGIPGL